MRIGIGYDIHRLIPDRPLMVGGMLIPYPKGLDGHSDADVLIHAIADALLGGTGQPDIGQLFPDTDPRYHGLAGDMLLQDVMDRVRAAGYAVNNVDSVLIAEEPKFGPHVSAIRERLACLLRIPKADVNVKAKTAEKMGPIGAGDAIAAYAVVAIRTTQEEG